jgi:hypothetical protein
MLQKAWVPMFCMAVDDNAPHRNEGDYNPRPHLKLAHELDRDVSVFVLK